MRFGVNLERNTLDVCRCPVQSSSPPRRVRPNYAEGDEHPRMLLQCARFQTYIFDKQQCCFEHVRKLPESVFIVRMIAVCLLCKMLSDTFQTHLSICLLELISFAVLVNLESRNNGSGSAKIVSGVCISCVFGLRPFKQH